jgi:predicted CoA-binding protein
MILTTAQERRALLARAKTVCIVGASAQTTRPSYFVYRYLKTHGFAVYPVNPRYESVDGDRCYSTLVACAADHGPPDVVDVFRKAEEAVAVVRDALAADAKGIWFQYGVINEEAIALADKSGLDVVYDRCMKVEHARFAGGLTIAGMNSGVITSRRNVN